MKKGKIKYDEFVQMTADECNKLIIEYGQEATNRCISKLNMYKGSNGKLYKSDYLAIKNWVLDSLKIVALKVEVSYDLSDVPENEQELSILKEGGVTALREYRKKK